jgi:hypothetical protein
MRFGLHQPYFFPYLGYYQLLFAVDRFVAYDDVPWIKGGWIPRNRLLDNGRVGWFTIPTRGAGSHVGIDTVEVAGGRWREKMQRTFEQAYARAPYRQQGLDLLVRTLETRSTRGAALAVASLAVVRA